MKRDDSDKAFQAFIESHPASERDACAPPPRETDDPLVHEIVVACLAWDAPRAGVAAALEKVHESLIDYNEFRVMIPEDAAALLGSRYPNAEERCARIRAALTEVFLRENGLVLAHLREANKRDAKSYLDTLPGLPAYAASRVALVGCGVHTFPVDSVLHALFDDAGVIEEGSTQAQLAGRLERAIRAGDAEARYWALEAVAAKPRRKPSKKPAKKTAKKKTGKATARKPAPASAAKKTSKKSAGKRGGKPA